MHEIHHLSEASKMLSNNSAADSVFFHLNLASLEHLLSQCDLSSAVFLGCELSDAAAAVIVRQGGAVMPELDGPYDSMRSELYSAADLFDAFDVEQACSYCDCFDAKVWRHWRDSGGARSTSIRESLARRLHDHAIDDAMHRFLRDKDKVLAVMGGHSMRRNDPSYVQVAEMSKDLAERGYLLTTGGGPGAMEATHLGVFFAGKPLGELHDAIRILSEAPLYKDAEFLSQAFRVIEKYPYADSCPESLGVPTWLYGHEPPNPFPTHIAKFFENAVREDGLVSIAHHGIIFAPGSAGTVQEIFQDATQNHYGTLKGLISPMAFLGSDYWTQTLPVVPLIEKLSDGRPYAELMMVGDEIEEIVQFILDTPPVVIDAGGWNVCDLHCGD